MKFNIHQSDANSSARAGTIETDHGKIETPIFMPVGTVASVKGVHQTELEKDINANIDGIEERWGENESIFLFVGFIFFHYTSCALHCRITIYSITSFYS